MRQRGDPIIWVRKEFEPDLSDAFPEMRANKTRVTIRGMPGCQIVPGSYDEEHHAITLRYLQGKIAKLMTNEEIRTDLGR